MIYRTFADLVVLFHLAFVAFVVLGGLLALRWPKIAWIHIPAAAWGVLIEYTGWICPLTPLENSFRMRGGEAGYGGGFVEHYLLPTLYPAGLARRTQMVLGSMVLLLNLAAYFTYFAKRNRDRSRTQTSPPAV